MRMTSRFSRRVWWPFLRFSVNLPFSQKAWKITILGKIFVTEMWSSLSKEFWFRLRITRQSSATNVRWKSHWCALCPVDALRTLWERFPDVPPHAPLFSYFLYGRLNCVAYTDFVKKVRSLVFRCGLKPDDYSGHSFRRGGCTWAWKNNMPTEYIMLQGDWRSTSWLSYLEIPLVMRWKMAKLLAESVHL